MNAYSDPHIQELVERFCNEINGRTRLHQGEIAFDFVARATREWELWNASLEQSQVPNSTELRRDVLVRMAAWLRQRVWPRRFCTQEAPSVTIIDVPSRGAPPEASEPSQTLVRLRKVVSNLIASRPTRVAVLLCMLVLATLGGVVLRSSELLTKVSIDGEEAVPAIEDSPSMTEMDRDFAFEGEVGQWPVPVRQIEAGERKALPNMEVAETDGNDANEVPVSSDLDRTRIKGGYCQ